MFQGLMRKVGFKADRNDGSDLTCCGAALMDVYTDLGFMALGLSVGFRVHAGFALNAPKSCIYSFPA